MDTITPKSVHMEGAKYTTQTTITSIMGKAIKVGRRPIYRETIA